MTSVAGPIPDLSAIALPELPATQVYLHPGHLYFTTESVLVTTILGPCVSVCIFDEEQKAAGVNHYLVPTKLGVPSPRYAEVANEMLLQHFVDASIPLARLRAKVFGGAIMRSVKSDLAERNIRAAFTFLENAGIAIAGSNTGGERGRKLHFRTTDGAAWIRFL